jgi:hypothetical protein
MKISTYASASLQAFADAEFRKGEPFLQVSEQLDSSLTNPRPSFLLFVRIHLEAREHDGVLSFPGQYSRYVELFAQRFLTRHKEKTFMDRRTDISDFNARIAYWRRHLIALEPKSESSLLQIASDAQRAESPMTYLNTYAQNLYDRLRRLDDSSDDEMDVVPVPTTGRTTGTSRKEKEESADSEDSSADTGLFSGTSLSASDRDAILRSGNDSALRARLQRDRKATTTPFDDAGCTLDGRTFTCGGNSRGFSKSSAKRHVEEYVAEHGFPDGMSNMDDVRKSLFLAASALVKANNMGSKGYATCATFQVNAKFTWNLIIEKKGTVGENYSIEHADINGIY